MKKNIFLLLSLIVTAIANQAVGQDISDYTPHAPQIGAALQFEEIPVSPYTGVPNISIPLYNVQTLSKNLAINLAYSYHPAGASKYIGGKGWSMNSGGFISRRIMGSPDELSWRAGAIEKGHNLYQYSFLGNSGRFILKRANAGTQLSVEIIETKTGSPNVKINVVNDPVTFDVTSFSICDENGHTYNFTLYDVTFGQFHSVQYQTSNVKTTYKYRPIFYLTSVTDVNGNLILSYEYQTTSVEHPSPFGNVAEYKVTNNLKAINITGKGKISFPIPGKDSFDVINAHNDSIKRLEIGNYKIIEKNFKNTQRLIHEFVYNDINDPSYTWGVDQFGYPRREGQCLGLGDRLQSNTDSIYSNVGTLQKIIYPGGGWSTFEFESNTYDYRRDSFMEFTAYEELSYNISPNIVYEPAPRMIYPPTFNVPGNVPRKYFISIINPLTLVPPELNPDPDGNPTYMGSTVKIGDVLLTEDQSRENYCYGKEVMLAPGTHSLSITPPNPNVKMVVKEMIVNQNLKKWFYGGGNRIKRITYYDGITKNDEGQFIPVEETNYKYNFFNDPQSSSGRLAYENFNFENADFRVVSELVGYKNVTVSQPGKGRTEYTYISPLDFPVTNTMNNVVQHYYDYKRGLETKRSVYDEAGTKLNEVESSYEYEEEAVQSSPSATAITIYERNGYVKKATTTRREFFKTGNETKAIESTEITEVNDRRQPIRKSIIAGNDHYEKKYFYYDNFVVNACQRRYDLERIEEWKNGTKLSTQKTVFNTFPGSIYQMPQYMQSAKAGHDAETKAEFVSYNAYRNPIEVKKTGSTNTIYLWGYNYSVPFAVIENASYNALPQNLIDAARLATNGNNEVATLTEINALRANIKTSQPNARITTFMYKPLIGITATTDPQENTIRYSYDGFGRLISVKDNDGNLVSETKYHFKNYAP